MRSIWRFPIRLTLAVLLFMLAVDLVFTPIHERNGGELTAWLCGLDRVLELPGLIVAESWGARFRYRTGWSTWLILLSVSIPIYLLLGRLVQWMWCGKRRCAKTDVASAAPAAKPQAESGDALESTARVVPEPLPSPLTSSRQPDPLVSRRGVFRMTRRVALTGVAGTAAYAFLSELRHYEVTQHNVPIRGLPTPLAGLRIVQLTDVHHGPWTSLAYVRSVVRRTNSLNPDIVVITGDHVHQSDVYIAPVVDEFAQIKARIGVVATLGNHDWWENATACFTEFRRVNIPLIDNTRLFVTGDRTLAKDVGRDDRAHAVCLAGVGDLWEGEPDYEAALGGVPDAMPRVLLSHNPDVAEEPKLLKYAPRVDFMISGHTHGGQVSFPLVGRPITLSKYGPKYAAGMVQAPLGLTYVSRGIGTTILPMRLGVRPELAVFDLQAT